MAVRKVLRHGKPRLFIDIRYKRKDGGRGRFRKDAQVQTMAAARAEERRYLLAIAEHGQPFAPSEQGEQAPTGEVSSGKTFADVVGEYRSTFMITDLKVTTRRGYDAVFEGTLLPRFGDRPFGKVDGAAAGELDVELAKRELSQATRNNIQIVLRSVLRFAKGRGYLDAMPGGMPRIKPVGQSILEIPSDEEVDKILGGAAEAQRLAFGLMGYAGLRPNEVRALRRRDVRLRWENGDAVGGFVSVREGQSFGETHTPKTGQREVPITPPLARLLVGVEQGARDGLVAVNGQGRAWGQTGLVQAFERVRKRVGLEGWSVLLEALCEHVVVTGGVPVHVVHQFRARGLAHEQAVCQ